MNGQKNTGRDRGNSRKEANTRWKEVVFQRVLRYNELIDKTGFEGTIKKGAIHYGNQRSFRSL